VDVKFLTIRQPWASLIAVGAKHIETRPFSTKYRGPLAIHAGKHRPTVKEACDLNEAWQEVEAPVEIDEFNLTNGCDLALTLRDDTIESAFEPGSWTSANTRSVWMPLGAVVAVCDLVDVVPIRFCTMDYAHVCHSGAELLLHSDIARPWADGETEHIVTDQLPFGDFTPGRFAWILDNVRPIDPVPMKGAQGLRDLPEGVVIP
jgi:hypothetical protein